MTLALMSEIEAFEDRLQRAIRAGHADELDVIGYGEVTIAVRLSTPRGDRACKRLVPFSSRDAALGAATLIGSYVDQLEGCGIDVVETETPILSRTGEHVLYCVQPMLEPDTLGPDFIRGKTSEDATRHVARIFERIRDAVTPTLAPDGQLSNWAFEGNRLRYLDVGTPFLRDEKGHDLFDFSQQTRALPAPVRALVDRFFIKGILDNYHSLRGQALDFLGNLEKEGLGELIAPLIPVANETFALRPGIDQQEVRRHYRSDAQTYAFIQAARRADRWFHRNVLRKPYPYLLPPRIDRYG